MTIHIPPTTMNAPSTLIVFTPPFCPYQNASAVARLAAIGTPNAIAARSSPCRHPTVNGSSSAMAMVALIPGIMPPMVPHANASEKGFKNIIATDFNDLRTREIPRLFRGTDFITLKLISSDPEQNRRQMLNREAGGLIDLQLLEESAKKIISRALLPNEILLDIAGKAKNEVLAEAIDLIDHYISKTDYDYTMPEKDGFYSWVFSDGLRAQTP